MSTSWNWPVDRKAGCPRGFCEKRLRMKFGAVGSNLTTGDGKDMVRIPADISGWRLYDVQGCVSVASSSGTPTFQLRRKRSGSDVDMLSTRVTIDVNEVDTAGASTAETINPSSDDVATGDQIYLDIDTAGTGTQLVELDLTFRRW